MTFATWLRAQIKARDESQRSFARLVGFSPNAVKDWLRGTQPSWENCQKIADTLSVSVDRVRTLAGYESSAPLSPPVAARVEDTPGWDGLTAAEQEAMRDLETKMRTYHQRAAGAGKDDDDRGDDRRSKEARPRAG